MRPAVLSANGTVIHRASRPRPGDDVRESVLCCVVSLSSVFSQSSRSVARSERPKERRERESERKTAQSVSQSVSQSARQSPAKRKEKKRTPLPVPAYACMVAPSTGTEEDPQSMPTFGGSHLCRFRAGPGRGRFRGGRYGDTRPTSVHTSAGMVSRFAPTGP